MSVLRLALLLLAAPLPVFAQATPADAGNATAAGLARCAAIADTTARVACYDALAGRSAGDTAPAPGRAVAAPAPAAAPMPAPAVAPAAAPSAAAAVVPQPASAPDPAQAAQEFGLSTAQRHAAPQGPQAITAHIAQVNVDQVRRSSVVLDNGQVWMSTEGEMLLDAGESVTISRAALGSFMLTSASHHAYHVRRVR